MLLSAENHREAILHVHGTERREKKHRRPARTRGVASVFAPFGRSEAFWSSPRVGSSRSTEYRVQISTEYTEYQRYWYCTPLCTVSEVSRTDTVEREGWARDRAMRSTAHDCVGSGRRPREDVSRSQCLRSLRSLDPYLQPSTRFWFLCALVRIVVCVGRERPCASIGSQGLKVRQIRSDARVLLD